MTEAADSQRRKLKFAAYVITVAAGLLVLGYLTADQWLAALRAVTGGLV